MIKHITRKITIVMASLAAAFFMLLPAVPAHALYEGSINEACKGATLNDNGSCQGQEAESQINKIARNGFQLFSIVIGFIAVIMIIIGGIKYVTSMGDPNSINGAKNTILYAIIGLVISAIAQVIVRFVLTKAKT